MVGGEVHFQYIFRSCERVYIGFEITVDLFMLLNVDCILSEIVEVLHLSEASHTSCSFFSMHVNRSSLLLSGSLPCLEDAEFEVLRVC